MARRKNYYDDYFYFTATRAIESTRMGSRRAASVVRSQRTGGPRGGSALERFVDSGRLSRGRSYARKGQVLSIEETKDGIAARVQGSMRTPYKIKMQISPLTDSEWDQVIDALSEQAIFTAQLLAGEMPQDIEQAFEKGKVSLFPSTRRDLHTDCSCPDPANPCKHIAATHYILGERFDEDPFLIFRLRGRTQEQVMQALRQRRAGSEEAVEEEVEEFDTAIHLEESLIMSPSKGRNSESQQSRTWKRTLRRERWPG